MELERLQNERTSIDNMENIRACRKEIQKLWDQEEQYWKARSRVAWLRKGDCNYWYFHAITLQRRNKIYILRGKTEAGLRKKLGGLPKINTVNSSLQRVVRM